MILPSTTNRGSNMIIISIKAAQNAKNITTDQQALVKEWTSFCQDRNTIKRSVYIDFSNGRSVGPWGYEERVRKFLVRSPITLEILTTSKTLDGAMKLAAKLSAVQEEAHAA
jgi:hypothetical protein